MAKAKASGRLSTFDAIWSTQRFPDRLRARVFCAKNRAVAVGKKLIDGAYAEAIGILMVDNLEKEIIFLAIFLQMT